MKNKKVFRVVKGITRITSTVLTTCLVADHLSKFNKEADILTAIGHGFVISVAGRMTDDAVCRCFDYVESKLEKKCETETEEKPTEEPVYTEI